MSILLACLLGLLFAAPPAHADTPILAVSSDTASATPGSSVTLTLTFTNVHDTPVQFIYQSIQPTWTTSQSGALYSFTACGASATACDTGSTGGVVHQTAPVAVGASTTVTLTFTVAANSPCGERIDFYTYLYDEYQAGGANESGIYDVPGTAVACA
ncbi:hypothetical protein GCM10009665_38800 [Kitasatospora nipponensis]|uniref:DUF11 domain-containing protein n=1 Tax=Kitasatospora nipponensis TaxID=258049 RepID=A0ABN1WCA9_9ACTN